MYKKQVRRKDLLSVILDFQKNLQEHKPTATQMYNEIQMMRFKIRPLAGDITFIDMRNVSFIEALWNLGKLDDFYRTEGFKYSPREREVFFKFFNSLHDRFVRHLQQAQRARIEQSSDQVPVIEMEIFREELRRSKFN